MSIRLPSLSCIMCLATFLNAAEVEKGFTSIFNGKDLTGWEGMPGMWMVKDGAITPKQSTINNWVFWRGGQPADFELRDRIAEKENDFARGFTEALIGYGLGRPFGFTDEDLALEILATARKEHNSLSEFIHALVQSKAFATK